MLGKDRLKVACELFYVMCILILLDSYYFILFFRVEICLEVGSGSGVVSAFLATMIGPQAFYMYV